jgi:hypothetical protein
MKHDCSPRNPGPPPEPKPKCGWCGEGFQAGESVRVVDGGPIHLECLMRMIVGSVAHQEQRCYCYGGDEDDPPGMTVREAARAAWDLCKRRNPQLEARQDPWVN